MPEYKVNKSESRADFYGSSKFKWQHHFIFWFLFFWFNVIRWGSYYNDFYYSFKSNLVEFPIHIFLSYLHAYILIPRLILKKKLVIYFASMGFALTAMYYLKVFLTLEFINLDVWPEAANDTKSKTLLHYVTVVLGELYIMGITTAIKLTTDYIDSRKKNQDLIRLNLETEIKYLRAQIQPHFFFNTLNNLYALTIEKSDRAPEVVLKLSELMQYVLYTAKSEQISLRNEIKYIESYLDLEKLRFGNRLKTRINIEGSIEGAYIPPMILLPFIENCFKHGVPADESDIRIDISFKTNDENIIFEIVNQIPKLKDIRIRQKNEGIGIRNVYKRLSLNFGENFKLISEEKNKKFKVYLSLPKKIEK